MSCFSASVRDLNALVCSPSVSPIVSPISINVVCRCMIFMYMYHSRKESSLWRRVDMVFTEYTKKRILFYHGKGYKALTIAKRLLDEGIEASRRGVSNFLVRVEETGSIARRPGSGRPRKRTEEVKEIVESTMRADDETTAKQLGEKLAGEGYALSEMSVLRCRSELGWTYGGSAYCQMIRAANRCKGLREFP